MMATASKQTYRAVLIEFAYCSHGLVSTEDAAGMGVPAVELRKLAARGALERVGHGLYRVLSAPVTNMDQYAWAVRAVGPSAYLMQDSVLALHDLALVNPARIMVGTPNRIWRDLPPVIRATRRLLPSTSLTVREGIAQTTVAQAILDCSETIMAERLRVAITDAGRQGLLTSQEQRTLRARLTRRPS